MRCRSIMIIVLHYIPLLWSSNIYHYCGVPLYDNYGVPLYDDYGVPLYANCGNPLYGPYMANMALYNVANVGYRAVPIVNYDH